MRKICFLCEIIIIIMANKYPTNFHPSTLPSTTTTSTHDYNLESNYHRNLQFYDSTTQIRNIQQQHFSLNEFIVNEQVVLPDPNVPASGRVENDILINKVIEYLKNREFYDCTLLMFYPKAALKSYATNKEEKRYFTPHPRLDLIGNGWINFFQQFKQRSVNPEATFLQEFNSTCKIHYLDDVEIKTVKLPPKPEILLSNSFKVYCSKENQIFLNFATFFGDKCIGTIRSQKITLISKPSKSANLCDESSTQYSRNFKNGDKISLFCRQATITTYLTTENGQLKTDTNYWSIFEIYKVNPASPFDQNGNIVYNQFEQLTYESTVILVDIFTKIRSPLLKIKTTQFNKQKQCDKIPVSEIHQCIFECVADGYSGYMTTPDPINNSSSLEFHTSTNYDTAKFQWFMVSADFIKHQFYPLDGLKEGFCIKKFPRIMEYFIAEKCDGKWYFKFDGENFSIKMQVWIGSFQCETKAICFNSIDFYLPTRAIYQQHYERHGIPAGIDEAAPIMLIDENGIIFHTFFSYYFTSHEELDDCGKIYQC